MTYILKTGVNTCFYEMIEINAFSNNITYQKREALPNWWDSVEYSSLL